jgi:suppressor of ftsI
VLSGTLTIAPAQVTVAGRRTTSNVIDGDFVPPTLRVRRGDTIEVRAVNRIGKAAVNIDGPQPTNVHYHGMDVSPIPPGDSVFIRIRPERRSGYQVHVPTDHPQGLHWYHAHVHHFVDDQIGSGVSGMLIVDGFIERQHPELAGLRERVMVLKDFTFPGFKDGDARTKSLNGYADPPIRATPGEFQIWEIGNLGADAFFDLQLEGHRFWVIERDGNLLSDPVRQDHLFLPPGARASIVVEAARKPGRYALRSLKVDTGQQGDPNPRVRIGTFVVGKIQGGGAPIHRRLREGPADPGSIKPNPADFLKAEIARTRYVDFSESAKGNTFFINGKTYDENRIDTVVQLGDVERWIVRNFSGELHAFHLHQTEFLVTKVTGRARGEVLGLGMRDVVNVPCATNGKPGTAELIIPFTNPVMVGEFVFHCHLVQHEDAGTMANISVVPRRTAAQELWDGLARRLADLGLPPLWPAASAAVTGEQALLAELDASIRRAP